MVDGLFGEWTGCVRDRLWTGCVVVVVAMLQTGSFLALGATEYTSAWLTGGPQSCYFFHSAQLTVAIDS